MIQHYVTGWLIVLGCACLAWMLLDWVGAFPEDE